MKITLPEFGILFIVFLCITILLLIKVFHVQNW